MLFLLFWAVLPFIFFFFSSAKLPHYILPIFPPLALLTGISLERKITAGGVRRAWPLVLSCFCLCLVIVGFILAASSPHVFPRAAQFGFTEIPDPLRAIALLTVIVSAGVGLITWSGRWKTQVTIFVGLSLALILYMDLLGYIFLETSVRRSTRDLATQASSYIEPDTQVIIYDTSLESLPFYLKINQPIWIVWSGEKASVMGSFYLAEETARSASGFGRVLLTFEEFGEQWAKAPKNHFVVLIKPQNLPRLEHQVAHSAKVLLEDRGLLLVSN
jgi:hypothetical protein